VLTLVLNSNISDYLLLDKKDKKKEHEMLDNTKVNLNISDLHFNLRPCKINRQFHLICRDKKFSNQFSVQFLINR